MARSKSTIVRLVLLQLTVAVLAAMPAILWGQEPGEPLVRNPSQDFNFEISIDSGRGIWTDGSTMWVADDNRLFAFNLETKQRDSERDFDTLQAAGNNFPTVIWSDGTIMWVVGGGIDNTNKIFAYSLESKQRIPGNDFNNVFDLEEGNTISIKGIWSNGTTMWVIALIADSSGSYVGNYGSKIHAFSLSTKQRDMDEDFDTLVAAGNERPRGIWSDGTTMWVGDSVDNKIYAYTLADKQRDPQKDIAIDFPDQRVIPHDITSDGTTMWLLDSNTPVIHNLYAYSIATMQRDQAKEFSPLAIRGVNPDPGGMWSDGITMWVADRTDGKIYAYNLASKQRDPSRDFNNLLVGGS